MRHPATVQPITEGVHRKTTSTRRRLRADTAPTCGFSQIPSALRAVFHKRGRGFIIDSFVTRDVHCKTRNEESSQATENASACYTHDVDLSPTHIEASIPPTKCHTAEHRPRSRHYCEKSGRYGFSRVIITTTEPRSQSAEPIRSSSTNFNFTRTGKLQPTIHNRTSRLL